MAGEDAGRRLDAEDAALQELDRLQRAIQESRGRRRQATDAFDSFVKSFGAPAPAQEPMGREIADERRAELATHTAAAAPLTQGATPLTREEPDVAQPVEKRGRPPIAALLGVGATIVGALVVVGWLAREERPREAPPISVSSPAEPSSSPAAAPAVTPPVVAPAPAPAAPLAAEIVTVRRVWIRVLVNGARHIERELDAGVRVPIETPGQLVIRAGDAGAVRVLIAGVDQGLLGRDGVAVTRTFTVAK